jgi:hypothetical protein
VTTEKLARDGEDARALDAPDLRPTSRRFANIHTERTGDLVEIRAIEACASVPVTFPGSVPRQGR